MAPVHHHSNASWTGTGQAKRSQSSNVFYISIILDTNFRWYDELPAYFGIIGQTLRRVRVHSAIWSHFQAVAIELTREPRCGFCYQTGRHLIMRFLGALMEGLRCEAVLFGVPFDGTASFRAGARFGPGAIRAASHSLETFSPFIDRDLEGMQYADWGDIEVPPGSAARTVELVHSKVAEIYKAGAKPLMLGGEHTVTLGAVQAAFERYPKLSILHLDAHTDLRDEYLGEKMSHATVMRRIIEVLPPERVYRYGLRAGTREEIIGSGLELPLGLEGGQRDIEKALGKLPMDAPLYVTIDLDVFDPSLMPGVGNPEPLGITYREFIQIARLLSRRRLIGADVVELAPHYDQTGVSAVVAASVVREMLICLGEQPD